MQINEKIMEKRNLSEAEKYTEVIQWLEKDIYLSSKQTLSSRKKIRYLKKNSRKSKDRKALRSSVDLKRLQGFF